MHSSMETLPETREELTEINRQLKEENLRQKALIESQESRIAELETKLNWLMEQVHLARHKRFGASSEKTPIEQRLLFNEAEAIADTVPEEKEPVETITYERKKRGRRPIPKDLPTERIEYHLTEQEQVCPQCGEHMHRMGEDIRHEIEIIPAKAKLIEHVRDVYSCRHCERHGEKAVIKTAKAPQPVIEKGLASPSSIAYVMTEKYVRGVPLYRQEKNFGQLGIELSRETMSSWVIGGSTWLQWIYDRLKYYLLISGVIHADETTLQVLKELGRAAETKSYMWLYRSGSQGPPIVLYEYQQTRSGEHPKSFLAGFRGYLQTDGYAGYHSVLDVILVGCWAHFRRYFDEALKGARNTSGTMSREALNRINHLFAIERELVRKTPEERLNERNRRSRPVVEEFRRWLDTIAPGVLPKSLFGKAVTYGLNQWEHLVRFLEDGRIELSNNRAERSIKPFVIGRKNFLFSNTPRGAKASAVVYSIVESAKENGLNPFEYLKYLFETLPNMDLNPGNMEMLDPLLPWNIQLP